MKIQVEIEPSYIESLNINEVDPAIMPRPSPGKALIKIDHEVFMAFHQARFQLAEVVEIIKEGMDEKEGDNG